MADKEVGKTTAMETFEARGVNGESYLKSTDGLGASGNEMIGDGYVNRDADVNPEVLEHAIEVLETKNKKWYAYLTTRDFWFVLALGYVLLSQGSCNANHIIDKSSPYASRLQTHSLPSSSIKELPSQLSKLCSTTSFSQSSTQLTPSTNMVLRGT